MSPTGHKGGAPLRATIDHLGAQGDGVALTAEGPVYVPLTAPGDVVDLWIDRARRGAPVAALEAVVEKSPSRRDPVCRHFGQCGGCALQHLAPDLYDSFAAMRIGAALAHQGIAGVPMAQTAASPLQSRRRLALKALRTPKGVLLGFLKRQSHHLVDIKECPVALPELVALFAPLRALLLESLPLRQPASITLTMTATGIDLLLDLPARLELALRERLAAFADRHDLAALHLLEGGAPEPVVIRRQPMMDFDGLRITLPPGGFVQATAAGEAALLQAVRDWAEGASAALDLFAGIGAFAAPLARRMPVLAIEGARDPMAALTQSARRLGLHGLRTAHRDLFRRPLVGEELHPYDLVVIDPPRAGAAAQFAALAGSRVKTVAAVSCNPNTFARDARTLLDGGYRLLEIRPVDQFLFSSEVELAALFRR